MAANVSMPVGLIWLAGSKNPYLPVSRSSKANEYLTPRTPYAQSFVDPELASEEINKEKGGSEYGYANPLIRANFWPDPPIRRHFWSNPDPH